MPEISALIIKEYLLSREGEEVSLDQIRNAFNLVKGTKSYRNLDTIISRLVDERIVRRLSRGWIRVIKPIAPVRWWEDTGKEEPLNFIFPRSHEDNTEFGLEDLVEVFAGDVILVAGASNYGKTNLVVNMMAENLNLMPCLLMGSEYTAADGKISPKFKRRMNRMNWVEWMKDGKPRFDLLPVGADYEDYICADSLNIIDWISLPGEYYLIDIVMKSIKDKVGHGIAVIVLQKNIASEYGEGGERSERYADLSLKIDPLGKSESMLIVGKVKSPKARNVTGKMWGFSIVDYGANLHNIREIVKCPKCWGKGYTGSQQTYKRCDVCDGDKFIDKT